MKTCILIWNSHEHLFFCSSNGMIVGHLIIFIFMALTLEQWNIHKFKKVFFFISWGWDTGEVKGQTPIEESILVYIVCTFISITDLKFLKGCYNKLLCHFTDWIKWISGRYETCLRLAIGQVVDVRSKSRYTYRQSCCSSLYIIHFE